MYLLLFFILACSAAASPAAPRELNHMMNPTEFHKVPSIPIMGTKVPFPVTLVKGWPGVGGGDLAGRTRTLALRALRLLLDLCPPRPSPERLDARLMERGLLDLADRGRLLDLAGVRLLDRWLRCRDADLSRREAFGFLEETFERTDVP